MNIIACRGVLLLSLLLGGCGGGDEEDADEGNAPATNSSCELTITGAIERTVACVAYWHQIPKNINPEPYFGATAIDASAGFNVFDTPGKIGTFESGDPYKAMGMAVDTPGIGQAEWRLYKNMETIDDQGDYTLTITGISDRGMTAGVHLWDLDGSLTATYLAVESTGATGEIEVRIEF